MQQKTFKKIKQKKKKKNNNKPAEVTR